MICEAVIHYEYYNSCILPSVSVVTKNHKLLVMIIIPTLHICVVIENLFEYSRVETGHSGISPQWEGLGFSTDSRDEYM